MQYSSIIVYIREGDTVTPVRVSKCNHLSAPHVKILTWNQLYGGHANWIATQIGAR